jgi:putative sigma-54 modulation protein
MKLIISGKGFEITDGIRERFNKKLSRLDKYFQKDAEAYIRISQERGGRNIVEITISVGGLILRAEEVSGDMYASIDGVMDKLTRQIRRHRTKLEKRLHVKIEPDFAGEVPAGEETPEYSVVRTKRFPVKPMRVDDAIAQMELLDHVFYLFQNEESDSMCVLYRRKDGTYGLLQPE